MTRDARYIKTPVHFTGERAFFLPGFSDRKDWDRRELLMKGIPAANLGIRLFQSLYPASIPHPSP